jgi:hypothetical protein
MINLIKNLKLTEILSIGFVVFLLLFLQQCNRNERLKIDLQLADQNRLALTDSVRTIKNRWGEEISLKSVMVANGKELRDMNSDLAQEIKRISGDVTYLQRMVGRIKSDTIEIDNVITEYPNGIRRLSWQFDTTYNENNGRSLAGYSEFSIDSLDGRILDRGTVITTDEIKLKLITGLTELDDSYQIFVKTDYPGLRFDQLDGSIIDKKKFVGSLNESSWVIGPYIGIGAGINTKSREIGPTISGGIGITYNLNKQVKNIFRR